MTSFRIRSTGQYPVFDYALRQLNPGISLPATIDAATAALVGADIVATADQPTIPAGQMAVEGIPAQQPDGSWLQTWTLVAGPMPTAGQTLEAKLADGIVITSTSTSALNGTYALDGISTGQIYQIGLYASQLGTFPSGSLVQSYPDAAGVPHNFTIAQFIAFLQVVAPLVSNLNNQAAIMAHGGAPAWPAQTGVIH